MLSRLLSYLFRNDGFQRYEAHPFQVLWAIFIMAVGVTSISNYGWEVFGIVTFILGALLGITIVLAINWQQTTRYWETVNEHVSLMMRVKNPDLWQALGYKNVPSEITVIEKQEQTKEAGYSLKYHHLPVSSSVMNELANKVLMSGRTTFTEAEYSELIPNFRKVKKQLIADGLLSLNNSKNVRLGHSWNRKGMELIYQYASDSIKLEVKRKDENARIYA